MTYSIEMVASIGNGMNSARVYELGEVPADAQLPTEYGNFRIRVFHEEETGLDHVALLLGDMGARTLCL